MTKLTFTSYQDSVDGMPLYDDPLLGLAGEVGEVIELIKKDRRQGDRRKKVDTGDLTKELGDVLWYLTRVASEYDIDLQIIADTNIEKLVIRHKVSEIKEKFPRVHEELAKDD